MAADPTGFDSRFDPAFQRGFDGKVAQTAPSTPDPQSAPDAPIETPASAAPVPDDLDGLFARVDDAASTEEEHDDYDADDEPRGPNPYLLALTVLSLLLIAGGLYTAQSVSASYSNDDIISSLDYVSFNLVIYGVPIAIALGVATGIGVLFVHAVRWNRGGVTRSRSNSRKNEA